MTGFVAAATATVAAIYVYRCVIVWTWTTGQQQHITTTVLPPHIIIYCFFSACMRALRMIELNGCCSRFFWLRTLPHIPWLNVYVYAIRLHTHTTRATQYYTHLFLCIHFIPDLITVIDGLRFHLIPVHRPNYPNCEFVKKIVIKV